MGTTPPKGGTIASWVLAAAWSAATTWAVFTQLVVGRFSLVMTLAVFTVPAIALTFAVSRVAAWVWARLRTSRWWGWVVTCLVAGLLLTLAIPVELSDSAEDLGETATLEIFATGDKHPESSGTEVWIFEITDDGTVVDLEDVVLGESWEQRDGALVSLQGVGDSAAWTGRAADGLGVVLLAHQYSGMVEISWAGDVQSIDLYDPVGTQLVVELPPSSDLLLYQSSVLLAFGIAFGLTLLALSTWLVARRRSGDILQTVTASASVDEGGDHPRSTQDVSRWLWVAFALPPAMVWTIHLLAFWPGLLSSDSIGQWGQVVSGFYSDWHPAFHSMVEWVLTRPALTPAVVAGAQVLALSGVVGWALATMRRLGFPGVAVWLISGVVAIWPSNGITVITLWKDVAYAIAVLALGVIMLREVDGRLSILNRRFGWAVVGGVAALVALFHHAGIYVVIGSLLVLGLASKKRSVFGAAVMAIALVALMQLGVYNAMGVVGDHPGTDGVVLHHLGAHLEDETPLTDVERARLDDLIPIEDTNWYNCETLTPVVVDPRFDLEEIHQTGPEARSVWLTLLARNPSADLEHLLCNSNLVWRMRLLPDTYQYNNNLFVDDGEYATIADNEYGLELNPVLPTLTEPLADAIRQTELPTAGWLWWRGPVYLYLIVFGALIAALRSANWRYWAVAVPSLLVAAVLAVAAPAQDFRYMYPVVLSGLVLAPYLLLGVPRRMRSSEGDLRTIPTDSALPAQKFRE